MTKKTKAYRFLREQIDTNTNQRMTASEVKWRLDSPLYYEQILNLKGFQTWLSERQINIGLFARKSGDGSRTQ